MAFGDLSEKQLLGLTAGVVGAVLLVMAGILLWMYLRYRGLIDDIKEKGASAASMEAKARDLKDMEEAYKEALIRKSGFLKRVPPESMATDLDAQISEQAANAKLSILKIEEVKERSTRGRTTSREQKKVEAIKIHVEAEGNFNVFGQFLNNIERNMDRFVAVTGFKITAYKNGLAPGKGPHEISLDLVTYKYIGGTNRAPAKR